MGKFDYFISVAENIHCTLIRKVGGKFAKTLDDGSGVVLYFENGEEKVSPSRTKYVHSDDWKTER